MQSKSYSHQLGLLTCNRASFSGLQLAGQLILLQKWSLVLQISLSHLVHLPFIAVDPIPACSSMQCNAMPASSLLTSQSDSDFLYLFGQAKPIYSEAFKTNKC